MKIFSEYYYQIITHTLKPEQMILDHLLINVYNKKIWDTEKRFVYSFENNKYRDDNLKILEELKKEYTSYVNEEFQFGYKLPDTHDYNSSSHPDNESYKLSDVMSHMDSLGFIYKDNRTHNIDLIPTSHKLLYGLKDGNILDEEELYDGVIEDFDDELVQKVLCMIPNYLFHLYIKRKIGTIDILDINNWTMFDIDCLTILSNRLQYLGLDIYMPNGKALAVLSTEFLSEAPSSFDVHRKIEENKDEFNYILSDILLKPELKITKFFNEFIDFYMTIPAINRISTS